MKTMLLVCKIISIIGLIMFLCLCFAENTFNMSKIDADIRRGYVYGFLSMSVVVLFVCALASVDGKDNK